MSEHNTNSVETTGNGDSSSDAKAVIALVVIIVLTACFWLTGQ